MTGSEGGGGFFLISKDWGGGGRFLINQSAPMFFVVFFKAEIRSTTPYPKLPIFH